MLHAGDIVEELATKRQGKVNNVGGSIVQGQEIQSSWGVHFSDGTEPIIKIFTVESQLKLVQCPHQDDGPPGFYPAKSIMDGD